MSIIHEALKKAGQPVITETNRPAKPGKPAVNTKKVALAPPVERHRGRSFVTGGPLLVLAVLTLIAGPFLVPLFYHPSPPAGIGELPGSPTVSLGPKIAPNLSAQFGIEEAPLPVTAATPAQTPIERSAGSGPAFRLTGVVYSDKDSYCLLNGRVVKQGETVGGATVEKITPNEVTLVYQGQRILVPVTDR